jgi:cobalt-zinc-cadmium efflux system membrane fusion protein
VPVISLASGRVIEVHARLGDEVKKGDLLLKVRSSDISGAYSDYRKAVVSAQLARTQLDRAVTLFDKGALAKKDLEVAQNAAESSKIDLDTTAKRLRLLGSDPDQPTDIVPIYAPVSGVVTDQQVTGGAGVQALNSTSPFTISDLSAVWILCDVFENRLAEVRLGEAAAIVPNAYPGRTLHGTISNIAPVLDPTLHTAKVRIEVANSAGLLRLGMFVTAHLLSTHKETRAMVPASAVLHLHDRDWVYVPAENGQFRRVEVVGGRMLPDNMQELVSGLAPGAKLVADALVLQNTVDQ